jgi:hypothetical protein
MTLFDDFDRRLGQFLDEGPVRASDRPVDAALGYARAHPRRRDPLAPFRRDPMAPRAAWSGRPALVFAVVGLLVVAGAAALVGGSRQPPIEPVVSASPSAPASPSPTVAPTPRTFSVEIVDSNQQTKTITVVDRSGLLQDVLPWEAGDPAHPANGEVEVVQLPADEGGGLDGLVLYWIDFPCGDDYRLTVDEAARDLLLERASCGGDAMGVQYQVWLDFSEPVPATEVAARLGFQR